MTWTTSCQSQFSVSQTCVTTLVNGWHPSANFISTTEKTATFEYFRQELTIPSGVVSAVVHVAALVDDKLLSGYKLYIDNTLVNVGPGRGEAPVWEDQQNPGLFRNLAYTTLDVTSSLNTPGRSVVALQAMHAISDGHPPAGPSAQQRETVTFSTDSTWMALNGDLHRRPGPGAHGSSS